MPYGQLAGAESLRDIGALNSHAQRLYHLCAAKVSRSTLSDANNLRSADLFTGFFARLAAQAVPSLRKKLREPLHIIDSTRFRLGALSGDWAPFSTNAYAVERHVIYDPDADCPHYAALSGPNVNDITAAKDMPIGPMATYVFDFGYYDYGWWAKLDAKGCHIVTSLKANTKLSNIIENAAREGSSFSGDRIGLLPRRLATSRNSPFADPVREARVRIETGKVLRILSKDLDPPAEAAVGSWKGSPRTVVTQSELGNR